MGKVLKAWHVKLKVVPERPYRHLFQEGIVYASDEKQAGEAAVALLKTAQHKNTVGDPISCKVEVFRVKRLRADFVTNAETQNQL